MGSLFDRNTSFTNLLQAARMAGRGKRVRPNVAAFGLNLEEELHGLQQELITRTYRPGPYRTFLIRDKKPRFISAAPFRDRVVHHALCQVIEPICDRGFLYDSYACRKGKGTHAAVDRASSYARRFRYVLKCDVERYFPSIDHAVLLDLIAERIWDEGALWLTRTILGGAAIRNLTCCATFQETTCLLPSSVGGAFPLGTRRVSFLRMSIWISWIIM
jgi:RNA-directed DNA polymerase